MRNGHGRKRRVTTNPLPPAWYWGKRNASRTWLAGAVETPEPRRKYRRQRVWNSNDSTTGAAAFTARSKAASEAVIMITRVRADPPGRSRM